jgi:hypothetical protein
VQAARKRSSEIVAARTIAEIFGLSVQIRILGIIKFAIIQKAWSRKKRKIYLSNIKLSSSTLGGLAMKHCTFFC